MVKFFSFFVKERFNNADRMKKVKCPTLFIHGQDDEVISC